MFQSADAGGITAYLGLEDALTPGLRTAAAAMSAFEGNLAGTLSRLSSMSLGVVGIVAIGGAFTAAAAAAANVQQQTANLNAILRTTPQQIQAIQSASLQWSQQTQYNISQIIQAERQLAKAHQDTQAIIAETPQVLNLASATQSDPTQAAAAFAAAQKIFRLSAADSKDTVNTLAQAVDASQGNLNDYTTAFKQIGPVAQASNLSLKETATAVADLSQAGLRGDAGAALRTFLMRIENPSKAAKAALDQLGISAYDAQGKLLPLTDIMEQLRVRTAGLSDEARTTSLDTIFGQRGARVADIYAEQGSSGYLETVQRMNDIGDAGEIARAKLDTLQGSASKLGSSINVLGVQFGTALIPTIRSAADEAENLSNKLSSVNEKAPIIPKEAVGVGIVGAELLAARTIAQRRAAQAATAAAPGIAQAAGSQTSLAIQREGELAATQQFQQAVVKAEFTADAEIANAHAEMIAKLDALDAAHADRVIATFRAQAAQIQAVYDQQVIAAEEAAAKQELAFAKQNALLDVNQSTARQRLALDETSGGFSPAVQLGREQELERSSLTEQQTVTASFDQQYAAIEEQSAQRRVAAIHAAGDEELAALRERATLMRTAIAETNIETVAATEAATANSIAASEEQLYAQQAAAQKAAQRAGASSLAKTGGGAAAGGGLLSGLGPLETIAIPLVIAYSVGQFIIDPLVKQREEENRKIQQEWPDLAIKTNIDYSVGTTREEARGNLQLLRKDAQDALDSYASVTGTMAKTVAPEIDYLKGKIAEIDASLAETSPQARAMAANTALGENLASVTADFENNRKSMDEAKTAAGLYAVVAVATGGDATKVRDALASLERQWDATAEAQKRAAAAYDDEQFRNFLALQKDIALGASPNTANLAVNGLDAQGFAGSKVQIENAKKDVADLAKAWADAQTAINGVDISKGVGALAAQSDQLTKARDELAKFGQSNDALTELDDLAMRFKAISDAEKAATADLDGYMLTLSGTNSRLSQVTGLQRDFLAALSAAEERKARGLDTSADDALIANRDRVLSSLANTTSGLQQNANKDWLGISDHLPDLVTADNAVRDMVAQVGGGKTLIATVDADTKAAKDAIDKILNPPSPYVAMIDLQLTPAAQQILGLLQHGGSAGNVGGTTVNTGASAGNGGPTDTPRGNAAALGPFAGIIQSVAGNMNVPPWLLGAIAMHESGGTPGAIQPNGLGRGITQVDVGQHPNEDVTQLTGKSLPDIIYQFTEGAKILAQSIQAHPGDLAAGVQGYAGTAYQSQGAPGVEGGLNFYDELTRYYKTAVQNALGGGSAGQASGPVEQHGGGGADATGGGGLPLLPSSSSILSTAQKHIGDKLDRFGRAVYGWCEEIVDDILQESGATDLRNKDASATGTADAHIRAAMAGKPGAGTVVSASQARAGDLVGWLGGTPQAGDPAGHIGVFAGSGQYIGTTPNGVQQRAIPDAGQNAIYIRPGGISDSAIGSGANGGPGTAGSAGGGNPLAIYQRVTTSIAEQAERTQRAFANLSPKGIEEASNQFKSISPILDKMAQDALPSTATGPEKQAASNDALKNALSLQEAIAVAMGDYENHTGNTAQDLQHIADLNGTIGPNLAQQVQDWEKIQDATKAIKTDQDAITAIDNAATARHQAERVADEAASRQKTQDGWTQQLSDRSQQLMQQSKQQSWQDESNALDDQKRINDRNYQDATTQDDRAHTVKMRQIEDESTALERLAKTNAAGNTAAAESFAALAAGPGTLSSKRLASENLAIQNEYDKRIVGDLNKQRDAIKDAQVAETRLYEDTKYHLDFQHTLDTRNFEDTALQATRNHEKIQRQWQADADAEWTLNFNKTRDDQQAVWRLQDQRNAADIADTASKQYWQTKMDQDKLDLQAATDAQKIAQDALTTWSQIGALVGSSGDALLQGNFKAQPTGDASANAYATAYLNYLSATYPNAIAKHAAGTSSAGDLAIVGDGRDGNMQYAEVVDFRTRRVISNSAAKRMGLLGGGIPRYAAGTGDVTHVTPVIVNLNMGDLSLLLTDADKREINDLIEKKIAARVGAPASRAALGNARRAG